MVKRRYSLAHKTMVKAMVSQENIFDKQLDYFKEKDKNINKNQTNMVKTFTKLIEVMMIACFWATNNNDNIQVPILAFEIGNDEN